MTDNNLYRQLGVRIGELVASKQIQYGDSARRAGDIMAILWPAGIPAHAYHDALLVVRVLDKLSRIAQRGPDGQDLGGESPWMDLCGYALLGWQKDDHPSYAVLVPHGADPVQRGTYSIEAEAVTAARGRK